MQKSCFRCGTEFTIPDAWARRGGGKFCGQSCYSAHQREHPHGDSSKAPCGKGVEKPCPQCGKVFRHPASQPREHCSRACLVAANSVTLTCVVCEKVYTVKRSRTAEIRPTCSLACRQTMTVFRDCARCGKSFRVNRPGHAHCSEECRRPPSMTDCLTCGKTFRYVPFEKARFCSVRCYRRHTGETTPERNVRLSLEALGVPFAQEEVIDGWRGPVDFLLADRSLIVEVDEPYWHDQVADRDARKDAFMRRHGWKVVRLVATPFYGDHTPAMTQAVADALLTQPASGSVPA